MKSEKLLPQVRVLYRPTSVCLPAVSSPSGRHPLVIENVERVGNDLHTVEVHSAYHITHVMVPFWYAFASYNPRMNVHSGKHLSTELRKACDSVEHRLWIASPYIGAWKSVRRILGKSWWDKEVDVKLLSDEEANPNGDTLRRFAQRGLIYHLRGLHAKIYIIDNKVLLTSANLTRTAFSCRYESGIFLAGSEAQSAIDLYESWLQPNIARPFDSATLDNLSRRNRGEGGEDGAGPLPQLASLPPDPGDFGGHKLVNIFLEYRRFQTFYDTLAKEYTSVQRLWPSVPLYFEVDGFLAYLFHLDEVSKPYATKAPRNLNGAGRRKEIRTLAKRFKLWAEHKPENGQGRVMHSKLVQDVLSRSKIGSLDAPGIWRVIDGLNCMNDARLPTMFVKRNTPSSIRKAWTNLLYGTGPLTERMSICAENLSHFKKSSIQELLGFYDPSTYPLRNKPVNAGLRFLGFDIPAN
jgi:hypothetical protein